MAQTKLWSSKLGFILATTGAAVGLGNLWRFPYVAGTHGGGTFVLLYCLCVLFIGIPIMFAEMHLGKLTRKNPVDALKTLNPSQAIPWHWLGYWGALGLIIVLSFYSVVAGWAFHYFAWALQHDFSLISPNEVQSSWVNLQASPGTMISWHSFFLGCNGLIALAGIQSGLERSTRVMMPMLYTTLIALVVLAWHYYGLNHAAHFLFTFDWAELTLSNFISALGHAFFTLAIGAGALLTYGAYAPKDSSLMQSAIIVALLDVLVALLAGLAVFPWVFGHGLPASEGPGLMFEALPLSLLDIPGGNWIASSFFLLLALAALTSSINIAEPLIVILNEKWKLSRRQATLTTLIGAWTLGLVSIFSFNQWQHFTIANQSLFEVMTNSVTEIILPLGGLGFSLFTGWILKHEKLSLGFLSHETPLKHYCIFCLRYLAPIAMLAIFLRGIL